VLESGRSVTDLVQTGETPARQGVRRRWRTSYHPVLEGGEATGVVAVVEELTATEAAAAAAHRAATASAALDAVYAETPVGLAFLNLELRFERANQALARMNGVAVEEHFGLTPEELLGERASAFQRLLEQVIATREPIPRRGHAERPGRRAAPLRGLLLSPSPWTASCSGWAPSSAT
jgi:PAS domain-containing protein